MKLINEAYEILGNEIKREEYNILYYLKKIHIKQNNTMIEMNLQVINIKIQIIIVIHLKMIRKFIKQYVKLYY